VKFDGYRAMIQRRRRGRAAVHAPRLRLGRALPRDRERGALDPAKSFLIDGEAFCCNESGVPVFQLLRQRRNESTVFLYAFELFQLGGRDLWREPIEARKADSPSLQSLCPANHYSSSWFLGRLSPSNHTVRRRMRLIIDDCVASSAVREDRATMGSLCSIEPRRGRL
jgi:hypothetical protein